MAIQQSEASAWRASSAGECFVSRNHRTSSASGNQISDRKRRDRQQKANVAEK
jgi:hypothetical protein